ncbi:hypothetical protein GCM10011390_40520 [Aureimonas endophytica]|uniref:EAL domain-containing protein n=1 Tax=Aureimonas endophytica TaxID=2027858 RepID=A0A917EAY6_9HYPH|nr:EAL domain-containing protein [Aureimonas endophytica]GGE17312.1 hypothetical protein GCM10011390_40520 [Aureimonas endophytica]
MVQADPLGEIADILRTIRTHLDMDVAFIGQFAEGQRIFRHVDSRSADGPIEADTSTPLDDSYCIRVVDGRLPELIPDTGRLAEAMRLPGTIELPVGAHLSVPLRLSDGSLYGTFCCFSHRPNEALGPRDLGMLRSFAEIAALRIERDLRRDEALYAKRERVRAMLAGGGPSMVYQPIFRLADRRPIGAEALSRFSAEPRRPPDEWFTEAGEVGLKVELELQAIRNAIAGFRDIWARAPLPLGVNASAPTILDARFAALFEGLPTERITVELTEHEEIRDYAPLIAEFACLRATGMRIAIDDVGAGFASMRHILAIRPDVMKIDMGLVRSIDMDAMRSALVTALVGFARQFECLIVAEGVETEAEFEVLNRLEVQAVQGYLLARPEPVAALAERLRASSRLV